MHWSCKKEATNFPTYEQALLYAESRDYPGGYVICREKHGEFFTVFEG